MPDSNAKIRMGVIGLGHWFNRLEKSLADASINVAKAIGTKSFDERAQRLAELGIGRKDYYIGGRDGSIPEGFFSGIEAVYVSSPNSLHGTQARQSLEREKCTIVEKTLATNERDFNSIVGFIGSNGYAAMTYLHLHYMHKQLTLAMDALLSEMGRSHGRIRRTAATFLEPYKESDRHRKWLFSAGEGGIFMDWIHPYEVLFHGAKASSIVLREARTFILNREYGAEPSGVEAISEISGPHFAEGAVAAVRVGKGARSGMKRVRTYFEDGAYADFDFANNEDELGTGHRGSWSLFERDGRAAGGGKPTGPDTSEIFAHDIAELCRGNNNGLTVEEIKRLYRPQWDFQRMSHGAAAQTDPEKVARFADDALSCRA